MNPKERREVRRRMKIELGLPQSSKKHLQELEAGVFGQRILFEIRLEALKEVLRKEVAPLYQKLSKLFSKGK